MKICVLGGTGKLGLETIRYGLQQHHNIVALARSPEKFSDDFARQAAFKAVKVDIFEPDDLKVFEGRPIFAPISKTCVLCPIESVDSYVPVCMKILKISRWFRPRRAVGFDRASGAIESYCPPWSKSSSNFSKLSCRQERNCPRSRWDRVYTLVTLVVNILKNSKCDRIQLPVDIESISICSIFSWLV